MTHCTVPPQGYICSRLAGHDGPCAVSRGERYGDWHIEYNPPPIPTRACDWQFWHDDFDGAPDANDNRSGSAASLEDAKMEIDMIEDMDREPTPEEQASIDRATDIAVTQFKAHMSDRMRDDIKAFIAALDGSDDTSIFVANLRKWTVA